MRRAFVDGANGFIGSALVRRLLKDGVAVRVMCRTPEKGKSLGEAGAEVVSGDVQDARCLKRYLEGCDTVFHAAAVGDGTASYQYNVNVQGTLNVAEAAHNAGVERFVHISTVGIYGLEIDGPIRVSQPPGRNHDYFYGQAKAIGERTLWAYAQRTGLPVACLRPAFVYGPGSKFWSRGLYQLCLRSMMPLVDSGHGNAHPIYIDDLVDLLITSATHPDAPGHVFHAAPDPAPTWRDYIGHYIRMTGLTLESATIALSPERISLFYVPGKLLTMLTRLTGQPRDIIGLMNYMGSRVTYVMDDAVQLLGWRPKFSLEQGMAATEPWLKGLE